MHSQPSLRGPLGQDVGRGFVHICICTYSHVCICTWVFMSVYMHVGIHVCSKHSRQPSRKALWEPECVHR